MNKTVIGRIGVKVISEIICKNQLNIPDQELATKKNVRNKIAVQRRDSCVVTFD